MDRYTLFLEESLGAILDSLRSARDGDFSIRLPADHHDDLVGQIGWAFNGLVERNAAITTEVVRVSQVVGREGRAADRASIGHVKGGWADCMNALNSMIED